MAQTTQQASLTGTPMETANSATAGVPLAAPQQESKFVFPATDTGNAHLLKRLHSGRIKFVLEWNAWISFENNRWSKTAAALSRKVQGLILHRYREATSKAPMHTFNGEPVSPDDALKWAKRSSSASRIRAMLELAKTLPGMAIHQHELDAAPCLLGVKNGVLDLRTGELRHGRPHDLITKYTRAKYDPQAICPVFLRSLQEITLRRQDYVNFLQEWYGYNLSGLTSEQIFSIPVGKGANGKTSLLENFGYLLGDYACSMPGNAFIASESRAIRNDLARLPGIRVACACEINTGKKLDEALIKRITGGDTVTARFVGKEFFDFRPVTKFIYAVNTLPIIMGADNGIYRRLCVMPFEADFSANMDRELPEKLKNEIDGILAWAVEGFQRWHERGHLVMPECVLEAGKAYRDQMDVAGSFVNDCCETGDRKYVSVGALYEAYCTWSKANCLDPCGKHQFGVLMTQKGFKQRKSGTRQWVGLALRTGNATGAVQNLFAPETTQNNGQVAQ